MRLPNIFGYTILDSKAYTQQCEIQYDLGLQLGQSRQEVKGLRKQLADRDEEFKQAVAESSFYREQYGRAIRVLHSLSNVCDESLAQLSAIEDSFINGGNNG